MRAIGRCWNGVCRFRPRRRARTRLALLLHLVGLTACTPRGPAPSVVLVVFDTTRFDAVSAYGRVAGTTPTFDALADAGLLYEHAYSNANWTLPAHASLFTGLLPSQHGVRISSDVLGAVPTLAGIMRDAGYETVGFSENPWLGPKTGTSAGFERFEAGGLPKVERWLNERHDDRPFLLFLNFMDAHEEYTVRKTNPFLPPGVTAEEAKQVPQKPEHYLCATQDKERELAILHGLYLGDVRAADAKLAQVVKLLAPRRAGRSIITVVTSDHGEYFGEEQFAGHIVGLHEAVLHIPLVVNGLPGVAAGRVSTPVQLTDLMPSILEWAHISVPPGLPGRRLPTSGANAKSDRPIVAESHDYLHRPLVTNSQEPPPPRTKAEEVWLAALAGMWRNCRPENRVDGDMRVLIEFPYKLEWYENHPPRLFDLSRDQAQQVDLAAARGDEVIRLQDELQRIVSGAAPTQPARALDPALHERVRALGYMGDAASQKAAGVVTPAAGQ